MTVPRQQQYAVQLFYVAPDLQVNNITIHVNCGLIQPTRLHQEQQLYSDNVGQQTAQAGPQPPPPPEAGLHRGLGERARSQRQPLHQEADVRPQIQTRALHLPPPHARQRHGRLGGQGLRSHQAKGGVTGELGLHRRLAVPALPSYIQ